MYLVFLDGSGNTGMNLSDPTATIYLLMGLAAHANTVRAIEDAMTDVLASRFGAACRVPGFECKGSDLYRGQGTCASMPPAERIDLYGELMDLVVRYRTHLVWEGIDKPRLAARYREPMHPHKLAFIYLVEKVELLLRQQRAYGLIVSDEEKEVEQQVVEDLSRYKETGTSFGHTPLDLRCIIDNVHWVKSHNSRLMQLCDCCAYLCQRYLRDQDKSTASARAVQALWRHVEGRVWRGRVWPKG
ncbi:MAG TPA: DUF3800 domain-containing protein [Longimicrobiaceae bacterium]|nr:DUF3800 domain-containing protein [Longimicrobiaceae bacterium]